MYFRSQQLHRSQLAAASWLIFMAGVAHWPQLLLYLLACGAAVFTHGWRRLVVVIWLIGCAVYGLWCYDSFFSLSPYKDDEILNEPVVIHRLPILHDDQQRLVVQTNSGVLLQLDTAVYPQYQYGDVIKLQCSVRLPKPIEGFAYEKYLARYHIVALCDLPTVTATGHNVGNSWLAKVYGVRNWLKQRVEALWPEPVASLILGVLIGEQDTIPEEVYSAFQQAGVVHILVVSGMHVLIIIQLLTGITRWLPKFWQTVVIIILLVAFCALTGFSATVIRAAVMGSIPLLGRLVYRPSHIALAMIWTAGIITFINPYILVHDIGFQLSFLATLGLVYVSPLLKPYLQWLPTTFSVQENVTTSLAAMTTTAPWIWYVFGTWSNVALLANVVVLPISNLMLSAGAGIVVISVVSQPLAQALAAGLQVLVSIMLWWVNYLVAFPWAYVQI